MLKKIVLYTLIYIVITFLMSYDEILCATNGEELCWYNLIGKYFIFLFLIIIYNKIIRPKIFKQTKE